MSFVTGFSSGRSPVIPMVRYARKLPALSRVAGGHKGIPYSAASSCVVCCSAVVVRLLLVFKEHQNSKMAASHWPVWYGWSPIPYSVKHRFKFENFWIFNKSKSKKTGGWYAIGMVPCD